MLYTTSSFNSPAELQPTHTHVYITYVVIVLRTEWSGLALGMFDVFG